MRGSPGVCLVGLLAWLVANYELSLIPSLGGVWLFLERQDMGGGGEAVAGRKWGAMMGCKLSSCTPGAPPTSQCEQTPKGEEQLLGKLWWGKEEAPASPPPPTCDSPAGRKEGQCGKGGRETQPIFFWTYRNNCSDDFAQVERHRFGPHGCVLMGGGGD